MIVTTSIGVGEHGAGQIVDLAFDDLSPDDRSRIFSDFSQGRDSNTSFKLTPPEATLLLTELHSSTKLPESGYSVHVANSRPSFNARPNTVFIKLDLN